MKVDDNVRSKHSKLRSYDLICIQLQLLTLKHGLYKVHEVSNANFDKSDSKS